MKIVTEIKQGALVVRINGELDMHGAEMFRQTVDQALDDSGVKHIVLNLEKVPFVDSAGLGVILGRYKKVSLQGGRMAAAHIQPQAARVMELSGLFRIIRNHKTEAEALDQLWGEHS